MLLSRHNTLTWRAWCLVAVAFNVILWASLVGLAELASKVLFAAS
jgi:hypothetical protein